MKNNLFSIKKLLLHTIQGKLFLVVLSVTGSILVLLGFIIFNNSSKNQHETTQRLCEQAVVARSAEVGQMLTGIVSELQRVAERSAIQTMEWDKAEAPLTYIASKRKEMYSLLFLVYPDGSYFVPKKGKSDKNLKERDYFKAIMNNNATSFISNPSLSKSTGEKKFTVAVPVHGLNGKVVGCLAVNVGLKKISEIAEKIKIGETGFGYIIDNEGLFVAHPNDSFLLTQNIIKTDSLGYSGLQAVGEQMMQGVLGSNDIINPDGTKSLYVFSPIPNSPQWSLGIAIPHQELYHSVYLFFRFLVVSLFLVIITLLVAINLLTRRVIINPIRDLSKFVQEIAQGHLYAQIAHTSNDEVGKMAQDLRDMQMHLKEIALEIRIGAMQIEESSAQLSGAAEQISTGASEQAASTEQVSASMEQMGATVGQNAQNAQQTEQIAVTASGQITSVRDAMKRTVEAMETIAEKVSIINDIAAKTDILAINAAIEAARAGESGKGFAVVADEVRKLAERSRLAAQEINVISNQSVEVTNTSFNLLASVIPNVEKTAILVKEIANSSSEQSTGIDQINGAVTQLTNVTQQNSTASEQMAAHSHQLADEAKNLSNMISFLQLKDQALLSSDEMIHKHEKEIEKLRNSLHKKAAETNSAPKQNTIKPIINTRPITKKDKGFSFRMGEHTDDDFEKI